MILTLPFESRVMVISTSRQYPNQMTFTVRWATSPDPIFYGMITNRGVMTPSLQVTFGKKLSVLMVALAKLEEVAKLEFGESWAEEGT